jgi:chromosome segregation ATPase
LQESIDNLRRERQAFDSIYKKLEKDLQEKKAEMQRIIDISNVAYEARDKAQQEMAILKAQADREQAEFEAQWKELGRLIENDRKMKELMKQKEKAGIGSSGKLEDEDRLRRKILRNNSVIAKDKEAQKAALQKVQSYEEAFAKIQASTGISDIDELVATFIEAEDKNFSLFNYVNELNSEVESLEDQIADIRREIERHKGQGQSTDSQKKRVLEDLEAKLRHTEARAEQFEARASRAMNAVNQLKQGIQAAFDKIGCNQDAVSAVLGSQGVTESNMMHYLGVVEQRTNEILQMYAAVQLQMVGQDLLSPEAQASLANILGHGPAVPIGAGRVEVAPPAAGEDPEGSEGSEGEEAAEEAARPLTRDELKLETLRSLARREGRADRPAADRRGGKPKKPPRS